MKTFVPDYYPDFHCKCGACRHCCCNGWGVSLTYVEYCRLIGLACSPELRRKLDVAFYFPKDRDEKRYAVMKMNYLGNCPLQREDGYCGLQCECGEDALPSICRMYPRNILFTDLNEGACANSCERVVEMLFERQDGLRMVEAETPDKAITFDEKEREEQRETIAFLQNRTLSMEERLSALGEKIEKKEEREADESTTVSTFFSVLHAIADYSPTFRQYATIAEENLLVGTAYSLASFREAEKSFYQRFPDASTGLENVINNHIIFERFPHARHHETVFEQYAALCCVFSLLRFITVGYTKTNGLPEDLVDCIAGLFRCFEHSDAQRVILYQLQKAGMLSHSFVNSLLRIF